LYEELKDIFTYKGGNDLPEGAYRLSGSSFSKWVSTPWVWYREQVLGLDKFEGSTSSVLGTCVHLAAECYEKNIQHIHSEVMIQMHQYANDNSDLNIDTVEINKQFTPMVQVLINNYLSSAPKATAVEENLSIDLGNNLYAQGQVDRREGTTIVDYKTFNSSTDPKSMPSYYKYQLLFYAWLYRIIGIHTDRIRLVYISRELDTRRISEKTGKPIGKVTPPRVVVLTEMINPEDIEWVDSMVNLWIKSINLSKEHPELSDVIFHDPRN